MKKHSPNFHTNLEEADKAKNNRASTFFWTVVLITTLMLGFSLTSCTKQAEKPIELKPPARSLSTVDITIKFFPTTHPLVKGDLYGLKINSSHIMRVTTQFWIEWKDGAATWQWSVLLT